MHIAVVTDQFLPQAATDTKQTVSMAAALAAAGNEVTLVALRKWFGTPLSVQDVATYYGVAPTFSLKSKRTFFPYVRGVEKVAHALAATRPRLVSSADVLLTRNLPSVLAALGRSRPVLYDTYRPWPLQRPLSRDIFRRLGQSPHFLGITAHSRLAATSYESAGFPRDKLLVAYNGFQPNHFDEPLSHAEARRNCGLPPEGPIVVYAGRISLAKGVGFLLDMAERLADVHFVLLGSEGHRAVDARVAGMQNVVQLPWSPIRETVPFLYAADVLIIPPTSAPLKRTGNTVLPIKTFHYMAAGRAILAPATLDVMEVLGHRRNAFLVKPDSIDEAVSGLGSLLSDDDLRRRLGSEAAQEAGSFTWLARARRVTEFLLRRLDQVH
jgi:glycosyltransferase involved in cell wall biosynthesis